MKTVSVVISTYSESRASFLLNTLSSLNRQSIKPCEIILVLDPSPSIIEFYKSRLPKDVKIVVSEQFGLSNARNAGVKNANGEIIAFIDDDAIADTDWIRNLLRNYEDPNVIGVGGLIVPSWQNGCPRWFPEELNWLVGCSYKGLPERKAYVRNPIGCNMSFRKEMFEEVGYFRADLGRFGKNLLGSEEMELSTRILKKNPNLRIIYNPEATVYHNITQNRTSFGYLWKRSFFEGLSKSLILFPKKKSDVALSAENVYLRYLLRMAVPSRLRRIYKISSLAQLLFLFISSSAVFLGFATGKLLR